MWGTASIHCYHRRVQNQPLKWWHVRWRPAARATRRAAILVAKIVVVLFILDAIVHGVIYLIQPWQGAQALAGVEPGINVVPAGLANQALAPLSQKSIDAFGFEFQLPNKAIDRIRQIKRMTFVSFHEGGDLLARDMSPYPEVDSTPAVIESKMREEKLLGQELVHSKFKLMQAAMSTTPDQVKWWRFRSTQNMRAQLLLIEKGWYFIECPLSHDHAAPVYAISFGQVHGFQFGNPGAPPYEAHIDVFDAADRHFSMTISGLQGHGQVLTQEELNAMVASIRPSPSN
jgi:hypothetical protein